MHNHGTLQWGRGLEPAETQRRESAIHSGWRLQWGRGLEPAETRISNTMSAPLPSHFNGAAGLNPRRLYSLRQLHRQPLYFNGAAGLNPRRLRGSWMIG